MFDEKSQEKKLVEELMSMPTHNYWVKFIYSNKKTPNKKEYFEFAQYDSEPYFPRINRFYEFCIDTMKQFQFHDYEIKHYPKEITKYNIDTDKEFIIH